MDSGRDRTASRHGNDGLPAAPVRLIEWTGERAVPWTGDIQVMYEHLHRYRLAATMAHDRDVLDLASGEGYGPALLARTAISVVGVEIDRDTVEHSRANYPLANLRILEGSMLERATVPAQSFDVVTCFEALEHVTEHDKLLDVVVHALRPGGVFVVSTPDRDVYSGELKSDNPHHVRELSRVEFETLLKGRFPHVAVMAQRVLCGSVGVVHDDGAAGPGHVIGIRGQEADWADARPRFPYLIAFASSQHLPPIPSVSVLMDVDEDLVRRSGDRRSAWLESERIRLEAALAEAQRTALEQIRELRLESAAELARRDEELSRAGDELQRLAARCEGLNDEVRTAGARSSDLQAQLDAVVDSRGWRAVVLYRRLRHTIVRRIGHS